MRMLPKILAGVLTAAVVAAAVVEWAVVRELRRELARQAVEVERVGKRATGLQAGAGAQERAAREARQAARTWSNRVVEVQAELAEERSTHEPLRQQIERMMQQEIVYKSQIEKKDFDLRNNGADVNNMRHDLESARSMATAHAQRIEQLESEAKTRKEELTALQKSLGESVKAAADVRVELKQTKERLAAALAVTNVTVQRVSSESQ